MNTLALPLGATCYATSVWQQLQQQEQASFIQRPGLTEECYLAKSSSAHTACQSAGRQRRQKGHHDWSCSRLCGFSRDCQLAAVGHKVRGAGVYFCIGHLGPLQLASAQLEGGLSSCDRMWCWYGLCNVYLSVSHCCSGLLVPMQAAGEQHRPADRTDLAALPE